ncbi:ral GTPase-activating subunit alpha-2 isoform X2, partial [Paramuricea clavata]
MFHSKKAQVDFKRVTQKFLDAKKESRQRAHALRTLLDNFETHEAKVFFQRHYSEIYYICHDYFSVVEVTLRQKANKSVRDDLDCVLYIFEKLLLLLPELVHERWQFASIGRTMLKLLHHGNAFKLRSEGIRLLIIWLQALQENMDISCEVMFACVVPGFPNPLDTMDTSAVNVPAHVLEDICNFVRGSDGASSSGSMTLLPLDVKDGGTNGWCSPDELQILVPLINQSQTEKMPGLEDLTKVYLDRVLDYMITQIGKIEWLDKSMRKKGFECLFNLFKKYYIHHVFPMWTPRTNLYATNPDEQVQELDVSVMKNMPPSTNLTKYADSVVKWFVMFLSKIKRVVKMQYGELQSPRGHAQSVDTLAGASSESQLSTVSENSRAAAIYEDFLLGGDIILDVIYSTRENVHIVHEVFRQAFLLPVLVDKSAVMKEVLVVYHNWLKHDTKPKFMLEPDMETISSDSEDVRAGMQGNVRLLIYHSSFIFLTPNTASSLKQKVYFCERVILMYRNIVLETSMVAKTWEQLLVVLLTVAKHVLEDKIIEPKMSSFCGRLAPVLLQTLFVTWIRANLNVTVSVELWDRFLDVVSSLTHWSEVVTEWKSTMVILTSVIAGRVYGLSLKDLPLDRLSEQKHKKRRHQLGSKNNDIDRTKVVPSPSVQESKPEVTSSSAAPVTVVPSTVKTAEPAKNEANAAFVTENQDKQTPEIAEEPMPSDINDASLDPETLQQNPLEPESENGYESDVTDSGSELSFGKTTVKASENDMSLKGLLGAFDSWPGAGASASREGSLDGEKGAISVIPEDEDGLHDSSASKSGVDSSANPEPGDEVDGRGRKDGKKAMKSFWKDSDGGDEISSGSENVPPSFCNPMHEDTSFDSVAPVTTQIMDDQNVTLEIVEPSVHSLDMDTEVSVVCGGTKEGWTPVAAVVLWTRVLGVLGNINDIESASIHAQVLYALSEIWHLLAKIRLNQGISEDNKSTPCLPNFLPPLHYFASWLFQAAYLPQKYKQGRLIAYQLICEMTVRRQDNPLSEDYLRHFYRCLHDGLTNIDQ